MTDQQPSDRLRAFVATREALGLRTYLTVSVLAVSAGATTVPASDRGATLAWLGASLVAQIAAGIVLTVGWWSSHRARWTRSHVIVTLMLAYATRGAVMTVIATSLGQVDTTSPVMRVMASMVNMTVWCLLAGAAWQARADYYRGLERALARVSTLRRRTPSRSEPPPDVDRTRERLLEILDRSELEEPRVWARALQSAIESDLRPLSHRLARRPSTMRQQAVKVRQLLWRASRQPLPIPLIAVLLGLFAFTNSVIRYGVTPGIIGATAYAVLLVAVIVVDGVLRRGTRSALLANSVSVVLLVLVVPIVMFAIPDALVPQEDDAASLISLGIGAAVIIVSVVVLQSAVDLSRVTLGELTEQLDALDVAFEIEWRERMSSRQQWALQLHNDVQAQLTAVRLEASRTASAPDPAHIERARQLVSRGLVADRIDPVDDLRRAIRSWSGLITIDLEVTDDVVECGTDLAPLCSFAQEAISNAVRHGGASRVTVTLESPDGWPRCTVSDNGAGLSPVPSAVGLGMHQGLRIDVQTGPSGTTVTALLP